MVLSNIQRRWLYLMERCAYEAKGYLGMYIAVVYQWQDEDSGSINRTSTTDLENWYDHNGFGFSTFVRSWERDIAP